MQAVKLKKIRKGPRACANETKKGESIAARNARPTGPTGFKKNQKEICPFVSLRSDSFLVQ